MSEKIYFDVGKRIHELRLQQNLSQEQLALCAEVTPTYLGLIERNMKNPTVRVIERICWALGIGLSDFFNQTLIPEQMMNARILRLINQLETCSDEQRQLVLQILDDTLKLTYM